MKDAHGNEVKVGDKVAYSEAIDYNYHELTIATVVEFGLQHNEPVPVVVEDEGVPYKIESWETFVVVKTP